MRLLFCLLSFIPSICAAKPFSGDVTFLSTATPGFLRINGEGGHVIGDLEPDGSGTLSVDLRDLKTGVALRDRHMHEKYLETVKYPSASLKLAPTKATADEFDWMGVLSLKKDKKLVHGKATYKDGKVHAAFTISMKDFPSIGVPSWAGVTAADDVVITIDGKY